MLLVHGAYHFWPKRVAFRNDYCVTCDGPRRAIAVRTFDVGHVFWIPILPVGFWRHWVCSACKRNPHVTSKMGRSIKWAGVYWLIAISIAFSAMWLYLGRHAAEVARRADRPAPRFTTLRFTAGVVGYVAGTVVAVFSPGAALTIYGLIAVYYLFEHLPDPAGIQPDAERTEVQAFDTGDSAT